MTMLSFCARDCGICRLLFEIYEKITQKQVYYTVEKKLYEDPWPNYMKKMSKGFTILVKIYRDNMVVVYGLSGATGLNKFDGKFRKMKAVAVYRYSGVNDNGEYEKGFAYAISNKYSGMRGFSAGAGPFRSFFWGSIEDYENATAVGVQILHINYEILVGDGVGFNYGLGSKGVGLSFYAVNTDVKRFFTTCRIPVFRISAE